MKGANKNSNSDGKFSREAFQQRIRTLREQIRSSLPDFNPEEKEAFLAACTVLQSAREAKEAAQKCLDELEKAGKKSGKPDKNAIAEATKCVAECESARVEAESNMTQVAEILLQSWDIRSSVDEAVLLESTVLVQATPRRLSEWVAQDPDTNSSLLDSFLSNVDWMKQMILCGGASNGNYGPAIAIHSTLLRQLESLGDNATQLHRMLALATALEHATPIPVFCSDKNTGGKKDKATDPLPTIDPINRYWHYVRAFDQKELDECFEKLSVWELRMVVDSNAIDEELQWGRDYLKAYRPDQIVSKDSAKFRYVWTVRTDINYHKPYHQFTNYRELLSAGGQCGPRAWMGRFICKAFGCPTWGVRQPGHAALTRRTNGGWVACLGGGFDVSYWQDNRAGSGSRNGPDFLEEVLARQKTCPSIYYTKLTLAECVADCMGEAIQPFVDPTKLWRSLALAQRKIFAMQESQAKEEDKPQGPRVNHHQVLMKAIKQHKIEVDAIGSIIIPATAFVDPKKPNENTVNAMLSHLGGTQLHLERDGAVAYQLPDFVNGAYVLTARIVNVHRDQVPLLLTITVPGSPDPTLYRMDIQYTSGAWQVTEKIQLDIPQGALLRVARDKDCHGLTIKDFTLVPVSTS